MCKEYWDLETGGWDAGLVEAVSVSTAQVPGDSSRYRALLQMLCHLRLALSHQGQARTLLLHVPATALRLDTLMSHRKEKAACLMDWVFTVEINRDLKAIHYFPHPVLKLFL